MWDYRKTNSCIRLMHSWDVSLWFINVSVFFVGSLWMESLAEPRNWFSFFATTFKAKMPTTSVYLHYMFHTHIVCFTVPNLNWIYNMQGRSKRCIVFFWRKCCKGRGDILSYPARNILQMCLFWMYTYWFFFWNSKQSSYTGLTGCWRPVSCTKKNHFILWIIDLLELSHVREYPDPSRITYHQTPEQRLYNMCIETKKHCDLCEVEAKNPSAHGLCFSFLH